MTDTFQIHQDIFLYINTPGFVMVGFLKVETKCVGTIMRTVLLSFLCTSSYALLLRPRLAPRAPAPHCSIAIFGASGGTGSEAVLQALERGEDVTCLVRDPAKLNRSKPTANQGKAASIPPSTVKQAPVEYDAASEARKAIICATSSARA